MLAPRQRGCNVNINFKNLKKSFFKVTGFKPFDYSVSWSNFHHVPYA